MESQSHTADCRVCRPGLDVGTNVGKASTDVLEHNSSWRYWCALFCSKCDSAARLKLEIDVHKLYYTIVAVQKAWRISQIHKLKDRDATMPKIRIISTRDRSFRF